MAGSTHPEDTGEASWVPKLGMVFDSDEKAYEFYCLYGREIGFAIRKHLVKRRSSGAVYSRVFACYREGFTRGNSLRADLRTGCEAHLTVRVMDDGRFRVSEFEATHNHELAAKSKDAAIEHMVPNPGLTIRDETPLIIGRLMGDSDSPLQHGEACPPNESWVPKLDMEFPDDEAAYQFYVNYAMRIGFSVRKHLVKRRVSGLIYSRTYVCHREGHQRNKDNDNSQGKASRTGCLALLTIKIAKNGRYRVTEFQRKHNHPLVVPAKSQLFKWPLEMGFDRTPESVMGVADYLARAGNEMGDGQAQRCLPNNFSSIGCKNYIPSCRERAIEVGDAGAVMQYVQEKQIEDPSFYYALQLDGVDQLTNFFWSDARSVLDFECFNDVLCFDTSYKTSGYGRPFMQFIGVNHHKQLINFGAALMYDETEESLRWLFNSFRSAMHGKQPKMVLTDRSVAMSNAIAAVWPGATHRYCVWQMYNYAPKRLNNVFLGSVTFEEDLSRCMYEVTEEQEFESGWKTMLDKYELNSNDWLSELYEDRDKWALAYGRETFSADMKNTLINESKNDMLKRYLNPERNLLDFFKHYERIVQEQRHAEHEADIEARQIIRRMPTLRMLRQTINAYTPTMFKIFQQEFEESMDCMVYISGQNGTMFEYKVTIEENPKEYIVRYDSSTGQIACTCKKFESVGIQCRHVLKTLDIINIKHLPPHYILMRWTKDAKCGRLKGNCEILDDDEIMPPQAKRYSSLCGAFNQIAARAAETVESYKFIETLSDQLMDQVCQILQSRIPEKP